MRLLRLTTLLVALLVLFGPSAVRAEEQGHALLGKPAPEITGDFALNGRPASLKDLKGKVVVLDFWAVWCGYCYDTFPHLREWHKEHQDKGLEVIGLTSYYQQVDFNHQTGRGQRIEEAMSKDQEQMMLRRLANHHQLGYRIQAADSEVWGTITQKYAIGGFPTVVVIDRQGVVQLVAVGSGQDNARMVREKIKELLDKQ